MKTNGFNLKFNLLEPDGKKSKADLDLHLINKEEKCEDKVIMSDANNNPIITQEQDPKKSKGIVVNFLSKFGSLNMDFHNKK